MGEAPWWYAHIRAAQLLGVPPWELADVPVFWKEAALEVARAEQEAQQHRRELTF